MISYGFSSKMVQIFTLKIRKEIWLWIWLSLKVIKLFKDSFLSEEKFYFKYLTLRCFFKTTLQLLVFSKLLIIINGSLVTRIAPECESKN